MLKHESLNSMSERFCIFIWVSWGWGKRNFHFTCGLLFSFTTFVQVFENWWSTDQLFCWQQMEAKGQTMRYVLPALTCGHHLALLFLQALQPCWGGIARERGRQKVCLTLSLCVCQEVNPLAFIKAVRLTSFSFFNQGSVHFFHR